MSHRINALIDDQLWEDLRQIPKGERSRSTNPWRLAEPQLSRLRRMQIPEISLDEATVEHALRLVTMKKAGFYDAAYHATAIVQRGLLVTADKKSLQTVAMMPM